MFSTNFNGDFRRKPVQSLRGASKKEARDQLLQRAQEERQKREDERRRQACALKIQSHFRGYVVRKETARQIRRDYDKFVADQGRQGNFSFVTLSTLARRLCYFFRLHNHEDGERLVALCQQILRHQKTYLEGLPACLQQLKGLLSLCLSYLNKIASETAPIAIPMRMLETFCKTSTYTDVALPAGASAEDMVQNLILYLVGKDFFVCMRSLLNSRVPASIEKSPDPPTPLAGSIFELTMVPVQFASTSKNKVFSREVLYALTRVFLCPSYTEQVGQFLLPAMAYGRYPFPFVELLHILLEQARGEQRPSATAGPAGTQQDQAPFITPWLLAAIITLGAKHLDQLDPADSRAYISLLPQLLQELPAKQISGDDDDEDVDLEEEEAMEVEEEGGFKSIPEITQEIMSHLNSPSFFQVVSRCLDHRDSEVLEILARICFFLHIQQHLPIHKQSLLCNLTFRPQFMAYLWRHCMTISMATVTGSNTPLIKLLAQGLLPMAMVDRIIPPLSVFCSLFNHVLLTVHDADFYTREPGKSSMPFSLEEMVLMSQVLRDVALGIIEIAHPDSKHQPNNNYHAALKKMRGNDARLVEVDDEAEIQMWASAFQLIVNLVRHLYNRDTRHPFCPPDHWLAPQVNLRIDNSSALFKADNELFITRPFVNLRNYVKTTLEEERQPLAVRDVRNLVILTELPFIIPFLDRVKILQKMIEHDRVLRLGEQHSYDFASSSDKLLIRRPFIYEDAFDKLSPANEPSLKRKLRVKLVNAAGLDEAGVDGGGIFREFLSELLKTAFDPNRGFFSYTVDRQLYPNPQAPLLMANFTDHYYFIGRMLGKALYENMLVELPFASFFLAKILSKHSASLDINHLASLDPEVYKNLLFLKTYSGDVSELNLDFTVVSDEFGKAKVVELKPNGQNIQVTKDNIIEYIHLLADYKLNKQIRPHCQAFRQGLADVISLEWLQMFSSQELQILISGASVPIDLDDLRRHTRYSGRYTYDHPVIVMFWNVVQGFDNKQRRQLLKFVTSCSRPPLQGFVDLNPPFCIHDGGTDVDRLPTASTCMNLLKLPSFEREELLREKLLYAISSGAGFELS